MLPGQDGFSNDQVRGFQATPQEFQVRGPRTGRRGADLQLQPRPRAEGGRHADAAGSEAGDELDPTLGPVVLQGITIP